jgi:tetratricopeptide (TPR) repeat protein
MKYLIRVFIVILIVVGMAPLNLVSAADQAGKMPITTSSEQAKTAYLHGRDLAEKLKGQESIQYFQKAVQADPNFAIAYLNLAFVQPSAQGFFDDLAKAVKLSNQCSSTEKLWIQASDAGSKALPQKQQEYLQQLVTALPQDERAHQLLGTFYFGQQQYDKAVQELQKAVAINANFSPAYNMLGYSYRFLQQYDQSAEAFKKYIQLIPDDPNPYDSYAELLMKIGKFDESIQNYRKALEIDPNFVNSYVAIATNLNYLGKNADARKELQTLYSAARNDGERRLALFGMTLSYLDEGNYQKALEEQNKMLEIARKGNDSANITGDLNTIGIILLENGRPVEAQAKFDEAARVTANSNLSEDVKKNTANNYLFLSARAALASDDLKKAQALASQYAEQILSKNNRFLTFTSHLLHGMIALKEKNYDLAIKELDQSNLQDPYNLYRLGLAYQGKGDQARAKEYFERAANFNGLNNLNYAFIRLKVKKASAAA